MPPDVADELLVACSLLPLAAASLRAPLRQYLSISDASEDGGAAAVAYSFTTHLDKPYAAELLDRTANVNEESSTVSRSDNVIYCVVCLEETPLYNMWGVCGLGCRAKFCRPSCFFYHRRTTCAAVPVSKNEVAWCDLGNESWLAWSLIVSGLMPSDFSSFSQGGNTPGVACISLDLASLRLAHKRQMRVSSNPFCAALPVFRSQVKLDNKMVNKLIDFLIFVPCFWPCFLRRACVH